jgi:hypothetical protein
MILNISWRTQTTTVHHQANVPSIQEFLMKLTTKFKEKLN